MGLQGLQLPLSYHGKGGQRWAWLHLSNYYRWKSHGDRISSTCVWLYNHPQDILHRRPQQASVSAANQGQSGLLWNCAQCTVSSYRTVPLSSAYKKIPQDVSNTAIRNNTYGWCCVRSFLWGKKRIHVTFFIKRKHPQKTTKSKQWQNPTHHSTTPATEQESLESTKPSTMATPIDTTLDLIY